MVKMLSKKEFFKLIDYENQVIDNSFAFSCAKLIETESKCYDCPFLDNCGLEGSPVNKIVYDEFQELKRIERNLEQW